MRRLALVGRILFGAALLSASVAGAAGVARAEYPERPIRFVQGFAPGGNADVISRVLGEELSASMKQPVIVESRPGAGGNVASEQIARTAADGYTIVLLTTAHVISPALYKSLKFDPVKDFDFITTVSDFPFFIVVNAESRFKTIGDLVAAAKTQPGTVTIGTAGVGTGQHMCLELFSSATGTKVIHVPYRGDSAAVTAVLGSNVDAVVAPGTAIFGNIEGGQLRALAVSGPQRWDTLPAVPTVAETVAPEFDMMAWVGVAAPNGLPRPILDKLNGELRRAIASPRVEQRLRSLGGFPKSSTPEEMTTKVVANIARWTELAEKAGIERQ